jgi:hypothetical protein
MFTLADTALHGRNTTLCMFKVTTDQSKITLCTVIMGEPG